MRGRVIGSGMQGPGQDAPATPIRWLRGMGVGALAWDRSLAGVRGVYGRGNQPGPRFALFVTAYQRFVAIVWRAFFRAGSRPPKPRGSGSLRR